MNKIENTGSLYRNFGDLKFVMGLGILGGAESKNRIHICPSGQDKPLQGVRFAVFRKTLKNLTKVSKVISHNFQLENRFCNH